MVHVTYSTGEKSLESLSKNIKNKLILPITRPCQFFSQPTILKKKSNLKCISLKYWISTELKTSYNFTKILRDNHTYLLILVLA